MSQSLEQHWMQKARFLTQALIVSGTLNIGLLSTFFYVTLREKQAVTSLEAQTSQHMTKTQLSNEKLLRAYSRSSFQDLLVRLESKELVEEGYTQRDLALACLIAFHHFPINRALGELPLQKRVLAFRNEEGDEKIELVVLPGLVDDHFEAILQFARLEKWPLTTKGLFFEIKRSKSPYDSSLLETFYLTPEFHAFQMLLQKSIPSLEKTVLVDLIEESSWDRFKEFADKVRTLQCYDVETARETLINYACEGRSKIAASLLFQHELDYVTKRLDDMQLLIFLDLNAEQKEALLPVAKELFLSPRSDLVRQKSASVLYSMVQELMPQPYDYQVVLNRFFASEASLSKEEPISKTPDPIKVSLPLKTSSVSKEKIFHKVQQGDSLWKISRKYGVSVESIIKANNLESDRLKLGKELKIPQKS